MAGAYKKIVFICYLPLTDKIIDNFYFKSLLDNGLSVEYWDVSDMYFKHIKFENKTYDFKEIIKKINTLKEFQKKLLSQDLRKTIFVPIITFEYRVLDLFRLLSKYKCILFFFSRGLLPTQIKGTGLINKILNKKKLFFSSTWIITFILNRIALLCKKTKIIKPYDLVFCAGQKSVDIYKMESKVIPINYFDYDDYLTISKGTIPPVLNARYCVFLDDHIVGDSDYKISEIEELDPSKYYKSINEFFSLIEEKLKVEVVIAAHPKSNYINNEFEGRKIFKNMSNALVKDCSFAITHYSSSLSYAVCYNKPLVFIYNEEIKKKPYYCFIKTLAEYLDSSICNMEKIKHITIKPINMRRYSNYKYEYLTSKSTESVCSREIVTDLLLNYQINN